MYPYLPGLLACLVLTLLLSQLRHRRRVRARIEAGAAQARGILNASTEGIVITDVSGEVKRFNKAAEKIFGYRANNIIGQSFLFLLPPQLHKTHANALSGPPSDPTRVTDRPVELNARKSDGSSFPVSLTVRTIEEDGETCYLGMFRDISSRRQAELDSQENRYLMEFLLQASPVVFYTCENSGGLPFTYISSNVEGLFGYSSRNLVNAAAFWTRYIHPDDREHAHPGRMPHVGKPQERIEYRLKMPDGNYRWVSDIRRTVLGEDGKPKLLIGNWMDIHDTKTAELELAVRQARFQVSLKCAGLVTWDWDIRTGRIAWSGDMKEILGLPAGDVEEFERFGRTVHPEDREVVLAAFRQCLLDNRSFRQSFRLTGHEERSRWIHMAGELIKAPDGSPLHVTGVLSDSSEQNQPRLASAPLARKAS